MSTKISLSGIRLEALHAFFDTAEKVLGKDNVSRNASYGALTGPGGQNAYEDPFPMGETHVPSGAVRPATVDELRKVIRLANEKSIPLWVFSRGKNLGYGGSAPVVNGSVILDLHRMNKIVEINEEYAYAIVEPGVSFFDLYEEIQRRGLKLWISSPALGWGSVLGNTLDRGFGYTPTGEHTSSQCGMEVVLPSGDLVRTGMGASDGNLMFALYKGGYGPDLDGLFYQSNLGVVSKIGIHLSPAPEAFIRCCARVPKDEDLVPLVGTLTELQRNHLIINFPAVSNVLQQAMLCPDADIQEELQRYNGRGKYVPDHILEQWRKRKGWGSWQANFALYGPSGVVDAILKVVEDRFAKIPGATVSNEKYVAKPGHVLKPDQTGEDLLPQNGIPSIKGLAILDMRERGGGHAAFSPLIPPSGRELYQWYLGAKKVTQKWGMNFLADFHVYPRYIIAINLVMFVAAEKDKMASLEHELLAYTRSLGLLEYRTHLDYMDIVAKQQDFNHGAFARLTTTLKDALDPNGILSPGKSGIWNSHKNFNPLSSNI